MVVRQLTDGQELDCVLLVRERELRPKRDGSQYLRLTLGDRTGSVAAVVWDGVADLSAVCGHGAAVRVQGHYAVHPRYGAQIAIRALRAAREHEVDYGELLDGPPRDAAQMEADLRELIRTVQNPHLRALLDAVLGPQADTWRRFRDAPAAKRYHQAYRHGLLEHSLTVAQSVSAIAATFPGIDRDVAVSGALLHDIGKLDAYTADPLAIDMTDAGKLQGEIPLGYYRVRRLIEDLPGFPRRARRGGAAHHPQPPRRARARLARRPVHARGDARAHDRQPRRPARLVRPAGEGAARRLALVGLRPRARRRGVLRRSRSRLGGRARSRTGGRGERDAPG